MHPERRWHFYPDSFRSQPLHSARSCATIDSIRMKSIRQWRGLQYPIECAVCGAGGDLVKTEDGKWKFVIAANGLERDRTSEEGRGVHCDEIADTQGGFFMDPQERETVAARLE